VEHPGEYSGFLTINNFRVNPTPGPPYIPPTWKRNDQPEVNIVAAMDEALHDMLTLAEDVLIHAMLQTTPFKQIAFYEIPNEERNPQCPVRLRVTLLPEIQAKLGRSEDGPTKTS
jgi:hypothetical protein